LPEITGGDQPPTHYYYYYYYFQKGNNTMKHSQKQPKATGTKRYYIESRIIRSTYIDIPLDDDIVDHLDIADEDFENIDFDESIVEIEE
jgi:hypothetical protein